MCNCGCDASLLTIPKGDKGDTGPIGPIGPTGPQGPPGVAASGTRVASEGVGTTIGTNLDITSGYLKTLTCTGNSGNYVAGDWGIWGTYYIQTTGPQTITIEYYVNGTLFESQLHDTAGSNSIVPICFPGLPVMVTSGDTCGVKIICAAGGFIKAYNINTRIG